MKKVLLTGIDSFTGVYLSEYLEKLTYDVYGTSLFNETKKVFKCNITSKKNIIDIFKQIKPDYIIHLSGISFTAHTNNEDFYKVNTIGTTNLLDAIIETNLKVQKIILASSAAVYGEQGLEVLDESLCPKPTNHYGASNYAMESLAKGYFNKLPIIITRPFNYTGKGQAQHFLIPKIVEHFKKKKDFIELGNLYVKREFNDISFVCEVYQKLIDSNVDSEIVNISSSRGIKLLDIIEVMKKLTKHDIKIRINEKFVVRENEIKSLTGSSKKLYELISYVKQSSIEETLEKMIKIN